MQYFKCQILSTNLRFLFLYAKVEVNKNSLTVIFTKWTDTYQPIKRIKSTKENICNNTEIHPIEV